MIPYMPRSAWAEWGKKGHSLIRVGSDHQNDPETRKKTRDLL